MQIACTMPPENLEIRRKLGLLYGCFGVFIALFMTNFIDYLQKMHEFSHESRDMKTMTATNYTIVFDLDEDFYPKYKELEMGSWIEESRKNGSHYLS